MKNGAPRNPGFEDPDGNAPTREEAAMPYPANEEGGHMPKSGIERIKEKYEQRLFSIDGVVGVGIGTNEIGDDVIVIYLRDETAQKRIPSELEGFSVRTQISGEFEAY